MSHLLKATKKIQILTMAPPSWSIEKTAETFGVSKHLVKQARELKKSEGILALPSSKKGKPIAEEIERKALEFYEDDEYSRLCPGKKDYVSVKIVGKRVHKHKSNC